MKKSTGIIIAVVVIVGLYILMAYNGLVGNKEAVTTAWAQVETQYQRRFDLIPNLVESVKGVMKQEQSIFIALSEARTRYGNATNPSDRAIGATAVESALGRLLVVVENYPQLKSAENVQTLLAQIEGTENRVSVERNRYNTSVRSYNLSVKRLPSSILARLFGFDEKSYFEATSGSDKVPEVKF